MFFMALKMDSLAGYAWVVKMEMGSVGEGLQPRGGVWGEKSEATADDGAPMDLQGEIF